MKKFTFLLVIIALSALGVKSQTLPYTDNFETYTVGGYLAVQNSTWWTTWSNTPGTAEDAKISNAFANSPTKSVIVEKTTGATDLLLKLGDKTTGKYELKWMMYIESNKCGYYNIQHFQSPGIEYAMEVYFRTSGAGELLAGSATIIPFTYPKDTWFEVKHLIDLDADNIKYYVNGVLVDEWPFSYQSGSTTGTTQLGGVDLFAGEKTGTTEVPKFFFDDVTYQVMPTVILNEDMESYALNSYLAVSNPTWFTTWSNQPGTAEDALIKDNFSNSPTKSAVIAKTGSVATDLILKLGDKTTGKYELSWWAYVEANKCGYYNIQHFQSPGTEYAMEVYLRSSGAGELLAGSATVIPFTYPKATWFQIKHIIDLDADNIQLYINGVMVSEWPFSYQASSTTGTNQLGGVDFFAGEKTGTTEVPVLYLDDIYLAQLGAPSDPIIGVDPVSLSAYLEPAASTVLPLTISNTGASELACELNIIYGPAPAKSNSSVNAPSPIHSANTFSECSAKLTKGSSRGVAATAVLNYDGDNNSAIGWNTPPVTVTVAARFPNGMTLPYAGMTVDAVDVFINDINTTGSNLMTLKIFGMGTAYEPGALLVSQTFTPVGVTWEHIVLNTPLLVNGEDLWVGYTFTQIDAGIFIPGTDAGPSNPNGDFISTGVGWSHLSNNPDLAFNWNIRALLSGDVMPHWLTASPMSGTVAPDENEVVDVTFNSADLAVGVYEGYIRILNNDPTNKQLDVPCMLSVSVGINELDKISVMVYPNPAENRLNIVTNDKIVKVSVMSYNGKTVITSNQNTIDISNLASGVYFVQTQTAKGISNVKFTKK